MAKQIENVLTLVKNEISTNLNAKLVAIQAEMADGVDLDPPMATSYAINELLVIDQLPFIELLPDTSDIITTGLNWEETDHKIIVIAHTHGKEGITEYCAKRTYRFARAIWEIILKNRTLSSNVIECYPTLLNYKPMMSDKNTLKQEVWIHITIKNEEK